MDYAGYQWFQDPPPRPEVLVYTVDTSSLLMMSASLPHPKRPPGTCLRAMSLNWIKPLISPWKPHPMFSTHDSSNMAKCVAPLFFKSLFATLGSDLALLVGCSSVVLWIWRVNRQSERARLQWEYVRNYSQTGTRGLWRAAEASFGYQNADNPDVSFVTGS
jgi:hypothetical protein